MTWRKYVERFPHDYPVTRASAACMDYLERNGKRLLCDFGFLTAEDEAYRLSVERYGIQ